MHTYRAKGALHRPEIALQGHSSPNAAGQHSVRLGRVSGGLGALAGSNPTGAITLSLG